MICFSNLIKFEARDNKIDDLIELEMCNTLEYLDLKNNLIEEDENINFLSSLTELKYLNLNGNAIQKKENYKELIDDYLKFVEKIDIDNDNIEEKENLEEFTNDNKNNNKNLDNDNNINSSNEKILDITNGSFDTRNQTKNSSMINSIDVNSNSSRPLSSNANTLMNFYKVNKNRNILDTENATRTAMDWKVANLINNNSPIAEGKEKIFNGIKSILASNKKRLNELSFNQDNKIEESFDINGNFNKKGFETERVFTSKGFVFNPIKPKIGGINNNNNEEINGKKVVKKPIIFKASGMNTNNTLNKTEDNIENSEMKSQSNTLSNFAKFKKEGQPILKPIIKKKIISNLDENSEINKTQDNPIRLISTNNTNEKPVLKKPIIFKQANTNINNNNPNPIGSDSSMSKRIFLNSAAPNTARVKIKN